MSEVYIKAPNSPRNDLAAIGLGLLLVASTFALLPLLMTLPNPWDGTKMEPVKPVTEPTPDSIPIEEPKPEIPKQEIEKPKIEPPPHQMSLQLMEALLNPRANGTGISVDFGETFMPKAEDIRIFLTGELDKKPRVLIAVKPLYPYDLQRAKTAGYAIVQFVIGPDGKVSRPRVVKSTHRSFEQAAIDAVLKSKWQPGRKDGKAVYSQVKLPVNFQP